MKKEPAIQKTKEIPMKVLTQIVMISILRMRKLFLRYNPITGKNAPGKRVRIVFADFLHGQELWVPVEMFRIKFFRALVNCGTIADYVSRYMPDEDPERARMAVIHRFIRFRCRHDFYFFAGAYARIKNKDGGEDIPFYLRPAQVKLCMVFEKLRLEHKPIRVILLKCRQWGGSTLTDIYMAWIMLFWKTHWNCNITGHQSASALNVFDMYERLINALPAWLFFEIGEATPDDFKRIKANGNNQNIRYLIPRDCKIQTGSAMNPESARSSDVAMAHITEEAFFPDTEKWTPALVVKSVISPIPPKEHTFIVRESTPNGMENEYHDEWVRANSKDEDGKPLSSYLPVFVAWFEIEDYTKPFKDDDERADFAIWLWRHRNDETGHGAYFWHLYQIGASLEGINWYIEKLKDYATIEDMQQEFPSDAVEAFKYSGKAVFDIYKVEQLREDTKVAPVFIGDIEGDSYDPTKEAVIPDGTDKKKYEKFACMQNLRLVQQPHGYFKVWDYPDYSETVKHRYIIGVDIGGSHKTSDWSSIVVLDRYDVMYGGYPAVVAEWHGHCNPDQLAMKCAQIAHFYQDAFLVVENNTAYSKMNNTDGDVSELFFPILVPLYDNLYNSNHSKKLKHRQKEMTWGYNTNTATKVAIVQNLVSVIRDRKYLEREPEALNEYSYYMQYPNGKYGNVPGKHDDRVMSRGIALIVEKEMPMPEIVVKKTAEEIMREKMRKAKPVAPELVGT
jgi:hypothetical protein